MNQSKTDRSHHRAKTKKKTDTSKDRFEKLLSPPIGFYNIENSLKQIRKKNRVALILKEHKKPEISQNSELSMTRFGTGARSESLPSLNGVLTDGRNGRLKRAIENQGKVVLPYKESAAMLVENKSYFRKIHAEDNKESFLRFQNSMSNRFSEMKEKLTSLKGAINQ